METHDKRTALLLSGQDQHFSKTRHRMLSEFSNDFGNVDIFSATWSDRFHNIDTRFNNDVDYLRTTLVPNEYSTFTQINSTAHVLISNNEMLDIYKRFNKNFDIDINVIQFIKYIAPTLLAAKSFELFKKYVYDNKLKYTHVVKSRFDLLIQECCETGFEDGLDNTHYKKLYTKNVQDVYADQDSYFGSQDTFVYLANKYLHHYVEYLKVFFKDNIISSRFSRGSVRIWPESVFKTVMDSIGIELENRYPYAHTGIYRDHLDDFGHVKDIRARNNREGTLKSWR